MKKSKLIILILLINFGCKVSKKQNPDNRKILSGVMIFEEFEVENSANKRASLKAFKYLTKYDSIFKLNEKTINEITSSEDSLAVKFFKTNFDSKGYVKDDFFLTTERDTSIIKIVIQPTNIFIPSSKKNINGKTDFYRFGQVIDRDSLYSCFGKIHKDCRKRRRVTYQNEKNYDIIFLKDNRKIIDGYDCFLVRCYSKKGFYRYELFVTSDISLNYNYLFNLKSLTDKGYFILEKTLFTQLSTRTTRLKHIELKFRDNL